MNQLFGVSMKVVAGSFALCISDEPSVACFGKSPQFISESDSTGFHMWLQNDTHIVDFMAPIYREAFAERSEVGDLDRLMFQRHLTSEAAGPTGLRKKGDFIFYPNPDLSNEMVEAFLEVPGNVDLLGVARHWYGDGTQVLKPSIIMGDDRGEKLELKLPGTIAVGPW